MRLERGLVYLAAAAFAACLVPVCFWLFTFWSPKFSADSQEWAAFGSYLGGVLPSVLAFVSFLGLLVTLKQQRDAAHLQKVESDDQSYFDHAVRSMERAYDVISDSGRGTIPVHDRLAWLTCARLLLSAKEVADRISNHSEGLRALFAGEQEHWRRKFYELFNPRSSRLIGLSEAYFIRDSSEYASPIEERSIRVIYTFLEWPDGMVDSIDAVPLYTREELTGMGGHMSGVRDYILSMRRFRSGDT